MDIPEEAVELREAVARIRRDLDAGHCTPERLAALELGREDLMQAGSIELLVGEEAEELTVEVELAGDPPG